MSAPTLAKRVATRILERLDVQYKVKGVRRDKAAIEMICGASMALEEKTNKQETLSFIAMVVCARGAAALEEIAAQGELELERR